jgi:hypothetical protein
LKITQFQLFSQRKRKKNLRKLPPPSTLTRVHSQKIWLSITKKEFEKAKTHSPFLKWL